MGAAPWHGVASGGGVFCSALPGLGLKRFQHQLPGLAGVSPCHSLPPGTRSVHCRRGWRGKGPL